MCVFAITTNLTDKGAAEVFLLMDNSHLSLIQWKCFQTLQGPTNSSLLNEIQSRIYEGLQNCSQVLIKRSYCSCPVLPGQSNPRSKFTGSLIHLPGAIKKPSSHGSLVDNVLVEHVGGGSMKNRYQSPQPLLWMPFTFSSFLLHASKLHTKILGARILHLLTVLHHSLENLVHQVLACMCLKYSFIFVS